MEWIKIYTRKWLNGSGRLMTAEERGVWADLLAFAGETKLRDGSLAFDKGKPMDRKYIADRLRLDLDLLNHCIDDVFTQDLNSDDGKPRIQILEDGTIFITNFARYQDSPIEKKKLEGRELELAQRLQAHKLAEKYPLEALNADAVKRELEKENA